MDELALIESKIYVIRNTQIMLDRDIAVLYGVETKRVNEAAKNNIDKFPDDFMFQLTKQEFGDLRSKISTAKLSMVRAIPKAFTEQGVYMLATVLKSPQATKASIAIMRTFTKIKNFSLSYGELIGKLASLEEKYDKQFHIVFEALRDLIEENEKNQITKIGFIKDSK